MDGSLVIWWFVRMWIAL